MAAPMSFRWWMIATAWRRHEVGFFAAFGRGAFNSGLKRVEMNTGASQQFDFGEGTHVGEPVFAPISATPDSILTRPFGSTSP